jgi:hypothetical protein
MTVFHYGIILLSLFLHFCIGRLFVRKDFFSSLLAGILISGGTISITARFAPLFTREIAGAFCLLGVSKLIWEIVRSEFKLEIGRIYILYLFGFLLFGIILGHHHYSNFNFETHDVVYLGPAFEMLKADYWGNLLIPVFFPYEMSAMHLLTSASIASLGFLLPDVNILHLQEIRFFMLVLFATNFLLKLWMIYQFDWKVFVPVSACVIILYTYELSNPMTNSGLLYFLISAQLILIILEKTQRTNPENNKALSMGISEGIPILFFSMFLIISRATLFFIASFMFLYFWWYFKLLRFHWVILLVGVLVAITVLTWVVIPHGVEKSNISIMNPFDKDYFIPYTLLSWANKDNFYLSLKGITGYTHFAEYVMFLKSNLPLWERIRVHSSGFFMMLGILVYDVIKFYGLFFIIYFKDMKNKLTRGLFFYMSISLAGVFLVRFGGSMEPMIYAMISASAITAVFLIVKLSQKSKWLIVLIPLSLFHAYGPSYPTGSYFSRQYNEKTLRLSEALIQNGEEGYYIPKKNEPFWKTELQALMSGLRVRAIDIKDPKPHSKILLFKI